MRNRPPARILLAILSSFVVMSCVSAAEPQKWTNASGRTMLAEFLRLDGDTVVFRKDGKEVEVPLKQLAAGDRQRAILLQVTAETSSKKADETFDPFDGPVVKKEKLTDLRVWSDRDSNKIKARFVRVTGSEVILKRGTRIEKIEFGMLSQSDQDYIRRMLREEGKEELLAKLESGVSTGSRVGLPQSPESTPSAGGSEDSEGNGMEFSAGFPSADVSIPGLESIDELTADATINEDIEMLATEDAGVTEAADPEAMLNGGGDESSTLASAEDLAGADIGPVAEADPSMQQYGDDPANVVDGKDSSSGDEQDAEQDADDSEERSKESGDKKLNTELILMIASMVVVTLLILYWGFSK